MEQTRHPKTEKEAYLPMDRIVMPSATLLDANSTPLRLGQQTALGERLGQFLGENDMSKYRKKSI